jgi:hypothetical protein
MDLHTTGINSAYIPIIRTGIQAVQSHFNKESIFYYFIKENLINYPQFVKFNFTLIFTIPAGITRALGMANCYETYLRSGNCQWGDGITKIYLSVKKGLRIPTYTNEIIRDMILDIKRFLATDFDSRVRLN